jgi:hypothetical protein
MKYASPTLQLDSRRRSWDRSPGLSGLFAAAFVAALLALALCLSATAQEKKKSAKPPEIVVVDVKAHRDNGRIALDGRIRNDTDKPVEKLIVYFDFMAAGGGVVTHPNTRLDNEELGPGEEAEFATEMPDPVRAVQFRVSDAVDARKREYRIGNPGPFPVE